MVIPYRKTALFITGLICSQMGLYVVGIGLIILAFVLFIEDY